MSGSALIYSPTSLPGTTTVATDDSCSIRSRNPSFGMVGQWVRRGVGSVFEQCILLLLYVCGPVSVSSVRHLQAWSPMFGAGCGCMDT